jgi:hypothetical protein
MLGVKGDGVELAILTTRLPLHLPLRDLRGILGLIPYGGKGRYVHELRDHITKFATALYINARRRRSVLDKVAEIAD